MTADELPSIVTIFSCSQEFDWHLVEPADDPGDAVYEEYGGYVDGRWVPDLPQGRLTLAKLVRRHGQVYVPISLEETQSEAQGPGQIQPHMEGTS